MPSLTRLFSPQAWSGGGAGPREPSKTKVALKVSAICMQRGGSPAEKIMRCQEEGQFIRVSVTAHLHNPNDIFLRPSGMGDNCLLQAAFTQFIDCHESITFCNRLSSCCQQPHLTKRQKLAKLRLPSCVPSGALHNLCVLA